MKISRMHYGKRRVGKNDITLADIMELKEACEADREAWEQARLEYFSRFVRPLVEEMFYELQVKGEIRSEL